MSVRTRPKTTLAVTLAVALAAGAIVAYARRSTSTPPPFPLFGVTEQGETAAHEVETWTRVGTRAESEETAAGPPVTWSGALRFDGFSEPTLDDWIDGAAEPVGRYARPIINDADGFVGTEVVGYEQAAYLFDTDNDGVIELAVFRSLVAGVEASPLDPLAFLAYDHRETAVAREGRGQELLGLYRQHGLIGVACGIETSPSPAADDAPFVEIVPCTVREPEVIVEPIEADFFEVESDAEQARLGATTTGDFFDELKCDFLEWVVSDRQDTVDEAKRERANRQSDVDEREAAYKLIGETLSAGLDSASLGDKLEAARTDAAATLVLKRFIVGKTGDKVVKELLKWQSDRPEMAELDYILYQIAKALLTGSNPVGPIAEVHLWSAKQARKMADILDSTAGAAVRQAEAALREAEDELRACRYRGGLPRSEGESNADPHIGTFDGLHFDFQGVGEFILARGRGLEVQVRYGPFRDGTVSMAVAAAARLPNTDSVVSVYVEDQTDDEWVVVFDGSRYAVTDGVSRLGPYLVEAKARSFIRFETDGSAVFEVRGISFRNDLFTFVTLDIDDGALSDLDGGILGNNDGDPSNDLTAATGEVLERGYEFRDLYDIFGDSWRVKEVRDSLFTYDAGMGPNDFYNPRFPGAEVSLSTLSEDELTNGLTVCLDAGVWIEPSLSECAFDVTVMDNDGWVEGGQQSQEQIPTSPARPLVLPTGAIERPGTYVLWQSETVTVTGLIAGRWDGRALRYDLRGLLIENRGDRSLIWPDWNGLPRSVVLDGAVLELRPSDMQGILATLVVDEASTFEGLAVDDGQGSSDAIAVIGADQHDRWSSDWLTR